MLVELSVMEQRYHAVMEVFSGAPVAEVARRYVGRVKDQRRPRPRQGSSGATPGPCGPNHADHNPEANLEP